jgi:hypothetical protein
MSVIWLLSFAWLFNIDTVKTNPIFKVLSRPNEKEDYEKIG